VRFFVVYCLNMRFKVSHVSLSPSRQRDTALSRCAMRLTALRFIGFWECGPLSDTPCGLTRRGPLRADLRLSVAPERACPTVQGGS
jgi:hypothetical protein